MCVHLRSPLPKQQLIVIFIEQFHKQRLGEKNKLVTDG
jgi:hypothetical protein